MGKTIVGQSIYKKNIESIKGLVTKRMPRKLATATVSVELGLSRNKVKEYLDVLVDYGWFAYVNDDIVPISGANAESVPGETKGGD